MILHIKYFGIVKEMTNCVEEKIAMNEPITIENLLGKLKVKYPDLNKISISVSVNLKLETKDYLISQDSEVAILPPFSGG